MKARCWSVQSISETRNKIKRHLMYIWNIKTLFLIIHSDLFFVKPTEVSDHFDHPGRISICLIDFRYLNALRPLTSHPQNNPNKTNRLCKTTGEGRRLWWCNSLASSTSKPTRVSSSLIGCPFHMALMPHLSKKLSKIPQPVKEAWTYISWIYFFINLHLIKLIVKIIA